MAALGLWLSSIAVAAAAATPLTLQLKTATSTFPTGDAALFEAGGVQLLEVLTQRGEALRAALTTSVVMLLVLMPLTLLMTVLLFVALSETPQRGETDAGPILPRSVRLWPRFLLLYVTTRLVQLAVLVVCGVLGGGVVGMLDGVLSERGADLAFFGFLGVGFMVVVAVQIMSELCRTALVRSKRWRDALGMTWRAAQHRSEKLLFTWTLPQLVGLAALGLAALIVGELGVEQAGAWRGAVAAAVHQLAFLVSCAAYASAAGLASEWMRAGGQALVQLSVATGGSLPPEVETHDSAP